jgi:hypothetical protein
MNGKYRLVALATLLATSLSLGACANDPSTQSASASERDTPVTGSHIGKRYTNGVDTSGVTTYGGNPGSTSGNGLPGMAPH